MVLFYPLLLLLAKVKLICFTLIYPKFAFLDAFPFAMFARLFALVLYVNCARFTDEKVSERGPHSILGKCYLAPLAN